MKGWRAGERPCVLPIDFPDMGKRYAEHSHRSAARTGGESAARALGGAGVLQAADERSEEKA
ncbi:hypothetical protein Cme02nite_44430 [Catellatospora methionotrophica]|uniref:Uncharacterized protein n=1 Tax=Catellatospora methionotrophica TaxID=121620 RepID=A0A8J3PFV8_9ACTN|nr:hypothetical protein Cme02nite_44430 [Catellatospora methionotrophica]